MYVVKLPYGLRQEGESERLVHISEIIPSESGLRCRCVCPSCGVRLQAKLPKTRKDFTPRFAHHRGDECEYAVETALHLKAKEIIEEDKQLYLNTAFKIVHECGTFGRLMRTKSPLSAKIIVQLYNLLYTYFMYEFSYK